MHSLFCVVMVMVGDPPVVEAMLIKGGTKVVVEVCPGGSRMYPPPAEREGWTAVNPGPSRFTAGDRPPVHTYRTKIRDKVNWQYYF